jgi:hypothetical protein
MDIIFIQLHVLVLVKKTFASQEMVRSSALYNYVTTRKYSTAFWVNESFKFMYCIL